MALINPPFSLHLEAPPLVAGPATHYGRFGPDTSALSHAYALQGAKVGTTQRLVYGCLGCGSNPRWRLLGQTQMQPVELYGVLRRVATVA